MSKMKDLLIGETEELSEQTGYSFEFLLDTWFEKCDEMLWEEFWAATMNAEWWEVPRFPKVTWTSHYFVDDSGRLVVNCTEANESDPFSVTLLSDTRRLRDLIALCEEGGRQITALRSKAREEYVRQTNERRRAVARRGLAHG